MVFDKTLPIEGALAPTYNNIMRADKTALEAALNAYFYFATGGAQTGQPRQGSCRVYYQDAAPTARLDGDYFDSTDYGCLWIDSNSSIDNVISFLSAADGAGTETWTPLSTEIIATLLASARVFASTLKSTGDFTVGADKVVVTAATGNTAIAGTLGVTGVATVAKGSLIASSDAPTTDAMISNKKYCDERLQTVCTQSGAVNTGATEMVLDDSKPQNDEGNEFITRAITPKSATSTLIIECTIAMATGSAGHVMAALFQDSDADALAVTSMEATGTSTIHFLNLTYTMTSGGTSEITFKIRGGLSAAGTVTYNGASASRLYGGAILSTLKVTEVR